MAFTTPASRVEQTLGLNPSFEGVIGLLKSHTVAAPALSGGVAPSGMFSAQVPLIRYYSLGGGDENRATRSEIAHYVALHGLKQVHSREVGSVVLTLMELIYPGLVGQFDVGMAGIRLNKVTFPAGFADYLTGPDPGTDRTEVAAEETDNDGNVIRPAIHDETPVRYTGQLPVGSFLEDLAYDLEITMSACPFYESIFLLGMIIYTIGKDPSELNFAAFTTRRLEMFRSVTGVPAVESTCLTPTKLPGVIELKKVKGFFNLQSRFRKVIVREFARWDASQTVPDDQGALLPFIRLWRNSGMTHVFMISSFINNYRAVIAGLPGIRTEVERFVLQYNRWQMTEKNYLSPYDRVIQAGKAGNLQSRDFPELLKLARWVAAMENPRMQNFANRAGKSYYQDQFIALAAEHNIVLTNEIAAIADDH